MKKKSLWFIAVLTLAAVAIVWIVRLPSGETQEDPGMLDDRFWVERMPDQRTEYVHGAFFISEVNFGLFERGSAYDIHLEFFDMSRDKTNIDLTFPQSGKRAKLTFTVKACPEKKPFDLCLDISENPWSGPKRYYGFRDKDDERKHLGRLAAAARSSAR